MKNKNYRGDIHPILNRIRLAWKALWSKEFILVTYDRFEKDGEPGKDIEVSCRTDGGRIEDTVTLKGAFIVKIASLPEEESSQITF